MTPREPDRFDAQARELWTAWRNNDPVGTIAAALRAEHASALGRAAQVARPYSYSAEREIRALIPPAAAPAADYDPITAPIPAGDMNGPHGPIRTVPMMPVDEAADARMDALSAAQPRETSRPIAPAAETGKGQGAEALPDPWALLDQARDWLDFMVKHPGDGVPHNLIARIDAALKRDARAAPPEEPK